MAILFCNIGWMKHYNGIDGDSIERGGEYNQHSTGHEVCNFSDNAGIFYGYVQPTGQIKIERLGASKKDESVSDITVVWTAGPEGGGTVVIGWYKHATVFREAQEIVKPSVIQKNNGVNTFRIKAPSNKAVLLPVEQRELMIPRGVKGGIGQSNVWYADKEESQEIVERVISLINGGISSVLPDVDQTCSILEGNPRLVAHLRRERNPAVVKTKKEAALRATGKLCCEACGFDFKEVYGEIGDGFCEVHHLQPLSEADGVVKTELRDLAIVCSNCHRIIHRTNPMLSISSLVKHLQCKCA
ncbi:MULTISPECIES: HNH endonuclease [unclassified Serratia (in: enterobacteria)]|uniref:HNH endonuclease n=1 Tax=unclassified Serratia (in: enterobacteria) TaxID=2647522 RepID=UPI0005047EE0|nr:MULTISPECIES: HNH endonuclease [unclassified Serratia (in: enterobacteria)]KFK96456.1 HNH endonuclease [Serratia sp. Ag2]KFK99931.1 HNH endonuclease [Serratia sp. Ag1]